MTAARRVGVLGGTSDPIHYGHLDAAEAARAALALDEVLFIPAHDPPDKAQDPAANASDRCGWWPRATQDSPGYRASDMELTREGASYTVDTLRALHADGLQAPQLSFILGADAFADIATWKEFPGVLDLAHFVVVARPGTTLDDALARTPELRTRVSLVEARTRDVSSTAIRARLTQRGAIDDLVPPAVARHIMAHHLYGTVDDLHGQEGNGDNDQ